MKTKKSTRKAHPSLNWRMDTVDTNPADDLPVNWTAGQCHDCRAETAFQAHRSIEFGNAIDTGVDFASWNIVASTQRAVIELVTASISVTPGSWAALRFHTSLGTVPSNVDLVLTPQGPPSDLQTLVCTHSLRLYTDRVIQFDIYRTDPKAVGEALICISGYRVDIN